MTAFGLDESPPLDGRAVVFEWRADRFAEDAVLATPFGRPNERAGAAVAVSEDARVVILGAPGLAEMPGEVIYRRRGCFRGAERWMWLPHSTRRRSGRDAGRRDARAALLDEAQSASLLVKEESVRVIATGIVTPGLPSFIPSTR